jgi:uncharacterized protein (DUF305 family)
VVSLLAASACSPASDEGAVEADSAVAVGGTAPAATVTQRVSDGATSATGRAAPRDSNQALLRMMTDHHEGLVVMADSAGERAQDAMTRADADLLRAKQRREQQEMLALLRRQYQDSIAPTVLPSNRAMLDSTLRAAAATFDSTFYRQVIHHHREGIAMSRRLMPHLTGEVREMTERMVEEQEREIADLQRKAAGASPG